MTNKQLLKLQEKQKIEKHIENKKMDLLCLLFNFYLNIK